MSHFIPSSDGRFNEFVDHLVEVVAQSPEEFQLPEETVKGLEDELAVWKKEYAELVSYRDAARAAVARKDAARKKMETLVRSAAGTIQSSLKVTDAARREAGLPVHKSHKKPIPAPTSQPLGRVELVRRFQQRLYFVDSQHPTRRSRPAEASGCQIYLHVGDSIPTTPEEYTFIDTCSKAPKLIEFKPEEGALTASYLLRWTNHKGEVGPWSDPVSATIPAV